MHNDRSHPLLAQLPLTVSPFLSLPTATTLPYTYKSLPSTLPESVVDPAASSLDPNKASTGTNMEDQKPQYVISPSSQHAAHPDEIIASCRALQAHLQKLEADARQMVEKWRTDIHDRDLAEKRRVAPGWLDVGEGGRMLVPKRQSDGAVDLMTGKTNGEDGPPGELQGVVGGMQRLELDGGAAVSREGEELDRAFGGPT